jgi:hypothetical protein
MELREVTAESVLNSWNKSNWSLELSWPKQINTARKVSNTNKVLLAVIAAGIGN